MLLLLLLLKIINSIFSYLLIFLVTLVKMNLIKINNNKNIKTWFCGNEKGFLTLKSIGFEPQVQCINIMGWHNLVFFTKSHMNTSFNLLNTIKL